MHLILFTQCLTTVQCILISCQYCILKRGILFSFLCKVSKLVEYITMIRPGEESDYFLLHTIISLVSLAVGSEDLPSRERVSSVVQEWINFDFVCVHVRFLS